MPPRVAVFSPGSVAEQDARLDVGDHVVHVVAEDLVHLRRAQDNSAVYGYCTADKAGACAAGRYGYVVLIADAHDLRDLLGTDGLAHALWHKLPVDRHLIVHEFGLNPLAVHKAALAHDGPEPLGHGLLNFCKVQTVHLTLLYCYRHPVRDDCYSFTAGTPGELQSLTNVLRVQHLHIAHHLTQLRTRNHYDPVLHEDPR